VEHRVFINDRFGDFSFHILADWFLSKFQSDTGEPAEAFLSNLRDEHSGLSDQVSDDLTDYRFVDCLRKILTEEDVDNLERIACKLDDTGLWREFPHTVILLLGLARIRITKAGSLYEVGRKVYDENLRKAQNGSNDPSAVKIALKAGTQLSRLETEIKDIWRYLHFELDNLEIFLSLRNQYYGTDDPAALLERSKKRWLHLSDVDGKSILDKNEVDQFGALHPLLLDLPVACSSGLSLTFAEEFSNTFNITDKEKRSEKLENFNRDCLAKNLRILQWEVLTQDTTRQRVDSRTGSLAYVPATAELEIPGSPPDRFLKDYIEKSLRFQHEFLPLQVGFPRRRPGAESGDPFDQILGSLKNHSRGFYLLLPLVKDIYPQAFNDAIEDFVERQRLGAPFDVILIEDGEFSFFTLLWLLRHAYREEGDPRIWREDVKAELYASYHPTDNAETLSNNEEWWHKCSLSEFATNCGLLVPSPFERYVLSNRWRSFLLWLKFRNQSMSDKKGADWKAHRSLLPVKLLDYSYEEKQFIAELWKFFSSDGLADYLDKVNSRVYNDEVTIEEFARDLFAPFVDRLMPLIEFDSWSDLGLGSLTDPDSYLIKSCRAIYLPLEYLFRACQPYEIQLLELALHFIHSDNDPQQSIPISLGFGTIAGALPIGVPRGLSPDKEERGVEEYSREAAMWLAPYRALFSSLSSEVSIGKAQSMAKQGGIEEMLVSFSHEVSKFGGYLFNNYMTKLSHAFSIDGEDAIPKERWNELAGHVIPAKELEDSVSEWVVCPVPTAWKNLKLLFTTWAGSKTILQDLGIHLDWNLSQLIDYLIPSARICAAMRDKIERDVPLNNIDAVLLVERGGKISLDNVSNIVCESVEIAETIGFKSATSGFAATCEAFLTRGLLAMLSNAAYHTPAEYEVKLKVCIESQNYVTIEAINKPYPHLQQQEDTKTHFYAGTKAVCQTSVKPLDGRFEMGPLEDEGLWRSSFKVPIQVGGQQWITID